MLSLQQTGQCTTRLMVPGMSRCVLVNVVPWINRPRARRRGGWTSQGQHPCHGRTSVSRSGESVSSSQDALSGAGQKRGAVVLAVWPGESDAGASMVAHPKGKLRLRMGNEQKNAQNALHRSKSKPTCWLASPKPVDFSGAANCSVFA